MLITNTQAEELWKSWPDKDTEEGRDRFFQETSWLPTKNGYLILVLRGQNEQRNNVNEQRSPEQRQETSGPGHPSS